MLTVSIAESLTGGLLSDTFVRQSGCSAYFKGSITAYTLASKVSLLHISESHARQVDCVSPRVAREMAKGVSELFKSDVGVATTGKAEPVPEKGFERPVAYYCCFNKRTGEWRDGFWEEGMEGGKHLERNEVRRIVTDRARKLYDECMEEWSPT
ncbi:hypothetical protein HDV00_000413 [Rhizophlyctis rosea]|nr:hypothetical protein HDV00_000413 [Rhizophlyctis rosea]